MGSRLGTHAIWTLTLSVAITLLALSPIVLPSGTPLAPLPGPLAGVERIGRVVVSALQPPHEEREATPPTQTIPPAPVAPTPVSAPETAGEGGTGVLAGRAGGEEPRRERPSRPTRSERPAPAVSPPRSDGERDSEKAEAKAEQRAEKAEQRADKADETAERQDEKKEKKEKKEKDTGKGHGSNGGKKSHPAHGEGGKHHS